MQVRVAEHLWEILKKMLLLSPTPTCKGTPMGLQNTAESTLNLLPAPSLSGVSNPYFSRSETHLPTVPHFQQLFRRPLLVWQGTLGSPSPTPWGTRPALLEEIKEGLKGKHKMSLMVLMKAPDLVHLTTHCAFPSNLPRSPQPSENCLVWTSLRAVISAPGSPGQRQSSSPGRELELRTSRVPWNLML